MREHEMKEGVTLSKFVAPDVRRDIEVVSAARLHEGFITARVRTTNLLYVARKLAAQPDFELGSEVSG